jgi:UDP-N-acetylmuramate dehydrogenase
MTFKNNVPLAPYTTFKIGGKALLYGEASSAVELAEAFERAEKEHFPIFVFSGGSNILFSDKGFPGLVVRITDGGFHIDEGGKVTSGAGRMLYEVVETACEAGFSGIENLAGVPGSVGGAVRGNAGAFGIEIGDVVTSVKAFHKETGMVREFRQAECSFGYRTSFFKEHPEYIILSAELQLMPGANPKALVATAREILDKREERHPQDVFCAGSFFMNPVITDKKLFEEFKKDTGKDSKNGKLPAGWLIDHAGLRGKTIGHAKISTIHPNYLINTGGATAEDVIVLASVVKQKVRDELGVQLQEEVQFVGFGMGKWPISQQQAGNKDIEDFRLKNR